MLPRYVSVVDSNVRVQHKLKSNKSLGTLTEQSLRRAVNTDAKYLDSENEMSTITIIRDGKSLVQRTVGNLKRLHDKYCPDGQTCNDIAQLGILVFVFVFMYIAMRPILIW